MPLQRRWPCAAAAAPRSDRRVLLPLGPALLLLAREFRVRGPQHLLPEVVVLDSRPLDLLEVARPEVEVAPGRRRRALVTAAALADKVLVACQRRRDLEGVADLPPVPPAICRVCVAEVIKVLLCKVDDATFLDHHLGLFRDCDSLLFDHPEPVDVDLEEGDGVCPAQLRVEKGDMHPGLDGFV